MIPVNPDSPKTPVEPEKQEPTAPQTPPAPAVPPGEHWLSAEEFEEELRKAKKIRIFIPPLELKLERHNEHSADQSRRPPPGQTIP